MFKQNPPLPSAFALRNGLSLRSPRAIHHRPDTPSIGLACAYGRGGFWRGFGDSAPDFLLNPPLRCVDLVVMVGGILNHAFGTGDQSGSPRIHFCRHAHRTGKRLERRFNNVVGVDSV